MKVNSGEKEVFISEIRNDWLALLLIAASLLAGVLIYPHLPERVPSHWNIYGQVDGYSSRFWGAFGLPFLAAGMYLALVFLPRIDPRKDNYARFKGAYRYIKLGLVAFMVFLHSVIIISSLGYQVPVDRYVIIGIGLLFMLIGNVMGQFRHNYFVGIRTPWTLASEVVWQKTHRLSSRIWFVSGLVTVVTGLFLGGSKGFIIFFIILAVTVIIPLVYSYIVYKQIKNA